MPDPSCRYFNYAEFVRRWGLPAVKAASNKGNSSNLNVADLEAVQESFDVACDELDVRLDGGYYLVPLDFSPMGGGVRPLVRRWAMTLAYADLYDVRGHSEKDKTANKIRNLLTDVAFDLMLARDGRLNLRALAASDQDRTPFVVTAPRRIWFPDSVPSRC